MRPCSVTHHNDFEQRYIALEQTPAPDNTVNFNMPPNFRYAPRGHYMMFLVSNHGVPSVATWIELVQ